MLKSLITTVVLLAISTGTSQGGDTKMILPKGAPPNAGWSYGILADDTLYVSGMAGEDAAGKIPPNFEDEVRQAFANIGAVLKEAKMSSSDVVSVQVYLTDGALFNRMNAVYKTQFKDPKPARTTVVVAKLVGDGHVEITVTAKKQ